MKSKVLVKMYAAVGIALCGSVMAQNASVGSIKVENAYTRATAPGQQVAGGFLKIENKGAADQLVSASSPAAGEVQLHEMAMDGNVSENASSKRYPRTC
jgi:copper(I)-binding protein